MKELEDNTIQMKKDLEMFMYQLRIEAEVHVLEMVSPNYQADQAYTNFVSWPAYNVFNQIVKDSFLLLYLKTILSNKYVLMWKSSICDTFEKRVKISFLKFAMYIILTLLVSCNKSWSTNFYFLIWEKRNILFSSQSNSDISAYTYERTLMMEQRTEMLKQMKKQNVKEVGYLDVPAITRINQVW